MPLPQFTPQTRVTAASARHDNIEYDLPLGIFRDVPPNPADGWEGIQIDDVAEFLGAPPRAIRSPENADVQSLYSCYFNRETSPRDGIERRLLVRYEPITSIEDNLEYQTAPLFSGKLNLRRIGARNTRYVRAEYWANTNPTRFVRYQLPPRTGQSFEVSPLFMGYYNNHPDEEASIDGKDNWLPIDRSAWRETYQSNWTDRLREYFSEIERAMRTEMERRADLSSSDGTETLIFTASSEPWNLKKVETYWEFEASTAPEFLSLFDAAMRSYCALPHTRYEFEGSPHETRRPPRRVRERTGSNGVSYAMNVKPGIRVVAYAKTNRRFRLEVRHDLRKLRSEYMFSDGVRLSREVNGTIGIVDKILKLSEDAAEILNGFLIHLERVVENHLVPVSPSPTEFLFQVASVCDSKNAAEVIVNLLLTERAVTRVEWLNNSINALKKAGVIERTANAQRQQSLTYVVTPAYVRAQEYLISVARPNDLTVGHRRRA